MRHANNGIRQTAPTIRTVTTKAARLTGRALVARRLRLWSKDPYCASCGRLVDYPTGFELDHVLPLHLGGLDQDNNCQILCVYTDPDGSKAGCHAEKTAAEMKALGRL